MKMTLLELRTTIKTLKLDLMDKKTELFKNTHMVKHITPEGKEVDLSEDYSFHMNLNEYEKNYETYIKYKAILQEANSKTFVREGLSLAEAIIKAKHLRLLMKDFEYFSNEKSTKKRVDGGYNSVNYYYEKRTLRYDDTEMVKKRNELREKLAILDTLIDKTNTETFVEVE